MATGARTSLLKMNEVGIPAKTHDRPDQNVDDENAVHAPKAALGLTAARKRHGNAEAHENDRKDDELGHVTLAQPRSSREIWSALEISGSQLVRQQLRCPGAQRHRRERGILFRPRRE